MNSYRSINGKLSRDNWSVYRSINCKAINTWVESVRQASLYHVVYHVAIYRAIILTYCAITEQKKNVMSLTGLLPVGVLILLPYLFDLPPWALIKFLDLESRRLFKVGAYSRLGSY